MKAKAEFEKIEFSGKNNEFLHPDLSQIAYYSFLDTLKLVQVKFWLFIWFKFKPHVNAVPQKGKLMLADGESLILSFSLRPPYSHPPFPTFPPRNQTGKS